MNALESQESAQDTSPEESTGSDALMFALLHAAQLLQDRIERTLETAGLSSAKFGVLAQLAEAGEPLPLGELAGRLSCVRSNMTQLIDRLVADGLVYRTNDPNDRRVVRAELTPLGKERAEMGARQFATIQAEFAALVPEADRLALSRIVSALR